jgi:galactoside O-acetyltransferase
MLGWNEEIKKEFKSCGDNVLIGHNTMFTNPENVTIGNNVRIDPFCYISAGELEIGDNVQITSHAVLGGRKKIKMGNWTFIGYGSKLFTVSEDYSGDHGPVNDHWGHNKTYEGDIIFNDYCGIASDVIVMPSVELPIGCTIGAQSFVYKSPKHRWSIWKGNPLEFHKLRNRKEIIKKAQEWNNVQER